jgi:hypothetical protein
MMARQSMDLTQQILFKFINEIIIIYFKKVSYKTFLALFGKKLLAIKVLYYLK